MRPGKSLRSPRKNESARRDTRPLQAGATNCTGGREPPLVEAKMGEPAGTGDCMEILAGPRKGGDGGRTQGGSYSRCRLRGIPEPSDTPRQEVRPGYGPGGGGTGRKGHVAPDV